MLAPLPAGSCTAPCQTCDTTAVVCVNATAATDPKNDRDAADPCRTGDRNGAGACDGTGAGNPCDVCGSCDGSGLCACDAAQDADCPLCKECSALAACANQGAGIDVNNDCDKSTNPCLNGTCNGAGGCAFESAGVDCDTCGACDAFGVCGYDADQVHRLHQ